LLLQHRYLLQSTTEWLLGEEIDEMTITEGGLKYRVDLGRKQNTGLFLDMRYGRDWVRANAEGKRVLNLFAYTCGSRWRPSKAARRTWSIWTCRARR
jgi:23S rRNA (cytosine1962-C5)-methyltransferase